MGTWSSLYKKLPKDSDKNVVIGGGEAMFRNANGNIVRVETHKKVIVQGLEDFIIVEKENVLLICPKKEEQEIKQIALQAKKVFGN